MPVLLLMDVLGMAAYRNNFNLPLIRFLVPVGTLVGALLFLAQRLLFPPRPDNPPPPKWLGVLLTVTSGFTSFVSHAGGPPLSPLQFTATMAFFFFVINLSKWIP